VYIAPRVLLWCRRGTPRLNPRSETDFSLEGVIA
jgi:hypothetical protein